MKIKALFLLLFLMSGFTVEVLSQDANRIYRLENGTVLNPTQLDSLRSVYNDQLSFQYNREGGEIVVTVTLPQDTLSTNNTPISTDFSVSDESTSFTPSESDSLIKEVIFMNAEEEEISKEKFIKLLEVPGVRSQYSITIEDGVRKTVMRPSTNEIAQEFFQEMDAKKESLNNMLGEKFPLQTLTDLDGTIYTPQDMAGKVIVQLLVCGMCTMYSGDALSE